MSAPTQEKPFTRVTAQDAKEALSSAASLASIMPPFEGSMAAMRMANAAYQLFRTVGCLLLRGYIAPWEILMRKRIGERYHGTAALVGCILGSYLLFAGGYLTSGMLTFLIVVYFCGAGIHKWICFFRDRKGGYWHSYSDGESWLRFPTVDAWLAERFFTIDFSKMVVEPAAVLFAAFITHFTAHRYNIRLPLYADTRVATSLWTFYLVTVAIVMAAYQLFLWRSQNERLLNEKDAQAEAEARNLAAQPTPVPSVKNHKGVLYLSKP